MEIDGALERNEFYLVLQPVFSLKTNSIVGCETLLRWSSRKLDNVGPDEFIPILEATDDIIPIGQWVLEQACLHAASWFSPMVIAVNISARQLLEADFVDSVLKILSRTGLSPAYLELELTESILITDAKGAARVIDELRSHGISIALDDFGTGFSSMSYLRDFAFDKIKIDKSFISGLVDDDTDSTAGSNALVHAIVNMAKTMNMTVTAEGIETPEQAKYLTAIKCEFGQGYQFAKPMGIDAFAAKASLATQRIAS